MTYLRKCNLSNARKNIHTCSQGDSGGPLMTEKVGRWYLIGIVSAGYSCAQRGQPGIYHRVAHTVDWISYIINTTWSWFPTSTESDLLSNIDCTTYLYYSSSEREELQSQKIYLWTIFRNASSFWLVKTLCLFCYILVFSASFIHWEQKTTCNINLVKWNMDALKSVWLMSIIIITTFQRLEVVSENNICVVIFCYNTCYSWIPYRSIPLYLTCSGN